MRRPRTVCLVAAAIAYLAIALWSFRAVLPALAALLPENPHLEDAYRTLGRLDRAMVLWIVTGNADRILDRPAQLRAEGQCHPLPRAYTLGEHMLGESLLASVPLALTGDPIASYNVLLIASLWMAALAMFLCARHFTRSDPAAFVAGLLFCLEPARSSSSRSRIRPRSRTRSDRRSSRWRSRRAGATRAASCTPSAPARCCRSRSARVRRRSCPSSSSSPRCPETTT